MQNKASLPRTTARDDDIITFLLQDALALLDRDQLSARRRIEQAQGVVQGQLGAAVVLRGGLAPWQARKTELHIREHLGSSLRIEEVATATRLSAGYFSKAFKTTFGMSFSDYVIKSRIEQAKRLLVTTDHPIVQIALVCGMADQAHLTRLFSRKVGMPPNAWRRHMTAAGSGARA